MTSTPLRASPPLHARPLVTHHPLSRTSADLTVADHQHPSLSAALPETLAETVALACMRSSARKKHRAPSDLNRTAAYQFG
jgi:hypothetical protein